jgi:hypothetical protein
MSYRTAALAVAAASSEVAATATMEDGRKARTVGRQRVARAAAAAETEAVRADNI